VGEIDLSAQGSFQATSQRRRTPCSLTKEGQQGSMTLRRLTRGVGKKTQVRPWRSSRGERGRERMRPREYRTPRTKAEPYSI